MRCSAVLPNSSAAPIHAYTDLVVLPTITHPYGRRGQQLQLIAGSRPATIVKGPEDCAALVGARVQLQVDYISIAEPKVKWFLAVSKAY